MSRCKNKPEHFLFWKKFKLLKSEYLSKHCHTLKTLRFSCAKQAFWNFLHEPLFSLHFKLFPFYRLNNGKNNCCSSLAACWHRSQARLAGHGFEIVLFDAPHTQLQFFHSSAFPGLPAHCLPACALGFKPHTTLSKHKLRFVLKKFSGAKLPQEIIDCNPAKWFHRLSFGVFAASALCFLLPKPRESEPADCSPEHPFTPIFFITLLIIYRRYSVKYVLCGSLGCKWNSTRVEEWISDLQSGCSWIVSAAVCLESGLKVCWTWFGHNKYEQTVNMALWPINEIYNRHWNCAPI